MTNACGIFTFNLGACVLGMLPWWAPYAFWAIVILFILAALARVYSLFGWPGVIATFGTVTFIVGFVLGRRGVSTETDTIFPGHLKPVAPKSKKPPNDLPPKSLTQND